MAKNKQVTSQELLNLGISTSLDIELFSEKLQKYLEQIKHNTKLQLENLYIDFKSAKFFQNFKAPEVKKDVASFANSEGGLIIYGINENHDYQIESCLAPKGENDPADALRNSYQSLAPYIYPKPRTYSLNIQNNTIVIIAIPRSEVLVPISIKGSLEYFLRIGSSTGKYEITQAPNYLVEDLISQRRNRPSFTIALQRIITPRYIDENYCDLALDLDIENTSVSWSEDGILGVIYYQYSKNLMYDIDQNLPRQIELAIDIQLGDNERSQESQKKLNWFNISYLSQQIDSLQPFQANRRKYALNLERVPLRGNLGRNLYESNAAVFIAPRNYPPSWFQLELSKDVVEKAIYTLDPLKVDAILEQVSRPVVSIEL